MHLSVATPLITAITRWSMPQVCPNTAQVSWQVAACCGRLQADHAVAEDHRIDSIPMRLPPPSAAHPAASCRPHTSCSDVPGRLRHVALAAARKFWRTPPFAAQHLGRVRIAVSWTMMPSTSSAPRAERRGRRSAARSYLYRFLASFGAEPSRIPDHSSPGAYIQAPDYGEAQTTNLTPGT
jgi:hypothetical protein